MGTLKRCLLMGMLFFVCLFDLILYVPSTIFQLNRDGSSWVEPVLSYDKCVLLKNHNAVTPVRHEPAASRSRVKHSTTEPLSSLRMLYHTLCEVLSCQPRVKVMSCFVYKVIMDL